MSLAAQMRVPHPLLSAVDVGLASIDDMSALRHLHASSARRLAAGLLSETEIRALADHIYTEPYTARASDIVRAERMTAARIGYDLVGTAGWLPANDTGSTARLFGVFVSPLYACCGIGRLLVERVEKQAFRAGYNSFSVRCPLSASGFFERMGYDIASHGVWPMTRETAIPVAFHRKVIPLAQRPPLRAVEG